MSDEVHRAQGMGNRIGFGERPAVMVIDMQHDFCDQDAPTTIEVDLSSDEQRLVDGLLEAGAYGSSAAEALRAAFMRWCNASYTLFDRPRLVFTSR